MTDLGGVRMGKVYLLDCTRRDGGYVNDWQFGEETIKGAMWAWWI